MIKVLSIFGTRPEAIKMAPLVKALGERSSIVSKVCITAQHREMLDQILSFFEIIPDYDLNVMTPGQSLSTLTSRILIGLENVLGEFKPHIVLVHGDTTTSASAALGAFYNKTLVGHVEAGLRTNSISSPWPEEANRRLTSVLANYHFAPTPLAEKNLLKENKDKGSIFITGNTVIDSLFYTLEKIDTNNLLKESIIQKIRSIYPLRANKKFILITSHRREHFDGGFLEIFSALREIAFRNPEIDIVFPVHLNPKVQEPAKKILSGIRNIYLIRPLEYEVFIFLMKNSYFIITDSGGIQEEAPSLGKPVLVMRESTERPEALQAGTIRLVGSRKSDIVSAAEDLLKSSDAYKKMSLSQNPYGDGFASRQIVTAIEKIFNKENL